ncbi:MAG: COX15/CtaA family protein [Spirochaetia bacterium]
MSGLKVYTVLAFAAVAGICVLIMLGGFVCFMEAAKAIPDWPTNFGGIAPPSEPGAFVEYLHRVGAVIVGLLIIALAVTGLRRFRSHPWLLVPPLLSLVLLAVVSTIGALVVLGSVSPAIAAVDLACALMVLALMVTAALAARFQRRHPEGTARLAFRDTFSRLALVSGVALYVVLFTGLSVGNPSPGNCLGLPLWGGPPPAAEGLEWLRTGHLMLSGAAVILVAFTAAAAWIKRRMERTQLLLANGAGVLLVVSLAAGELAAAAGFPWALMAVRVCAATLLWAVFTALIIREGLQAAVS